MSQNRPAKAAAGANQSSPKVEWRYFCVGVLFLLFGIGLALWAFSKGQLTPDQRMILLWALPIISGFVCGSFTGSLTVNSRGFWPGVVATATGGFGVWLLTYFMLPNAGTSATSLDDYKVYINQNHKSNLLSVKNAIERDPAKATELGDGEKELEQAKDEIIVNVDERPGLPARMSIKKYNNALDEMKKKVPEFKPVYLLENAKPIKEQFEELRKQQI
jgi:hypothetical protein